LLDGKEHALGDGDVYFDCIWVWEWALIAKIESMAVDMALAVFSIKSETNARCLSDVLVDPFQATADLREVRWPNKGKVEVFREAVVAEVAALERGATLEDKQFAELTLTQAGQKPCQTVIPLQHGFGYAAATAFFMQPVCQ
jgi:hypothetical protein